MEKPTTYSPGNYLPGQVKMVDLTPGNIASFGLCGYKDANKHPGLKRKIDWFTEYYPKGLRIKTIVSETEGAQGMIEYIPGEFAHRPVSATGYMFIHCLFMGYKSKFKGKGYASLLIDECIREAEIQKMKGVAVVTRNGSFMANKEIFLKKGFTMADKASPDFELLYYSLESGSTPPAFRINSPEEYPEGLTILRSPQCPYTFGNVAEIMETAREMNVPVRLIDLKDPGSAQASPCAFGTFGLIFRGKIISYHPISNTRFKNIMKTLLPEKQ